MSYLTSSGLMVYERLLEQYVYTAVVLKTALRYTKKKYMSSFGNLEDAKYMTQTSLLILSKWDNLVNVIALLFDIDLNNLALKNFMHSIVKADTELRSLFTLKQSILQLQMIGQKIQNWFNGSSVEDYFWMARVAIFYYYLLFLKTLTWNGIILSLLVTLAKTTLSSQNTFQLKNLSNILSNFIDFFKKDHLQNIIRMNQEETGNTLQTFETNSNEYSDPLLSNIKTMDGLEPGNVQYSYWKSSIIPSANGLLVHYWSSVLASIIPSWFRHSVNHSSKL